MMVARGLEHEIQFAARRSVLEVIPRLAAGRLAAA
jgi:phosphosulfolactate phosphohydrolase-like enzyme